MIDPVKYLVEASEALTRYRMITAGQRPPFDDLIVYEWLTTLVPERAIADTPEDVMRKVLHQRKFLCCDDFEGGDLGAEADRVDQILDQLGYGCDELDDNEEDGEEGGEES